MGKPSNAPLLAHRELILQAQNPECCGRVGIAGDSEVIVVDQRHLVRIEDRQALQLVGPKEAIGIGLVFLEDDLGRNRGSSLCDWN